MPPIDSSMIKSVMESPVPIAALTVVCFVAWRQMSLVRNTVRDTLLTFRQLFKSQEVRQDKMLTRQDQFLREFNIMTEKNSDKLAATNALVTDLNGKLAGMPALMEKMVEKKLSMHIDTGSAIEDRLKNLETRQIIQGENFKKFLETVQKIQAGKKQ